MKLISGNRAMLLKKKENVQVKSAQKILGIANAIARAGGALMVLGLISMTPVRSNPFQIPTNTKVGQPKPGALKAIHPDLSVVNIKIPEDPSSGIGKGGLYAQPILGKTKAMPGGTFTVTTMAFERSGQTVKIVEVCKKTMTWDNSGSEFLEHPALRCDIENAEKAKRVNGWEVVLDPALPAEENNKRNNRLVAAYLPDLSLGVPVFSSNNIVSITASNLCPASYQPGWVQVLLRVYSGEKVSGAPKFVAEQKVSNLSGGANETVSFDISSFAKGKDIRPGRLVRFTLDQGGNVHEVNKKNNEITITNGLTASAFPPQKSACTPRYTRSSINSSDYTEAPVP